MKKIQIMLIALAFLTACGSTPKKADDATVDVEDRNSNLQELNDPNTETQSFGTRGISRSDRKNLGNLNLVGNREVRIIYFDFDSSSIKPEDRQIIESHAAYLVANRNILVTLSGHADERGSREYNLALGEQRANTVKRLMTLLNVLENQIKVTSYGEEKPIIAEQNEYAWSQNRRVEIIY